MDLGINEPSHRNSKPIGAAKRKQKVLKSNDEIPAKSIKTDGSNNIFNILNEASLNSEFAESIDPQALMSMLATGSADSLRSSHSENKSHGGVIVGCSKKPKNDGNGEEKAVWQEEFKELDQDSSNLDKKDLARRRQMAKNREYAKKVLQKKKDQRKEAEERSSQILDRIDFEQKTTLNKEKNASFAVYLRTKNQEKGVEEIRERYEKARIEMNKKFDEILAQDELLKLKNQILASSREKFEKAARNLQEKNGNAGTLGPRKNRAKQKMELMQLLYTISVNEHKLRREVELSILANTYVRDTVPGAAPLAKSMPKHLLDELIKTNRACDLEEFIKFVAENP